MELNVPRRGLALDAAQTVLNVLNLRVPPIDPGRVIRALKHRLVEVALPDVEGFTTKHRQVYLIFVNKRLSPAARRFTMAHELGHIVLGHLAHTHTSRHTDRMMDKEANWFAAELLMPRDLFTAAAYSGVERLSEQFDLAPELVQMRLSQLGIGHELAADPFESTFLQVR